MKRIVLLLAASLSLLTARGQESKYFSLEKRLEISGINHSGINDSVREILKSAEQSQQYKSVSVFSDFAICDDNRTINYYGKKYRIKSYFFINWEYKTSGTLLLQLDGLSISATQGRKLFSDLEQSDPTVWEGYFKGYRNLSSEENDARFVILDEMKMIRTVEFEAMTTGLIQILESKGFQVKVVQ